MNKEQVLSQIDFKSFYHPLVINLKENGNAQALGLCPWHPDHNPSLSINLESGLFNCLAGCGGGDVFTFYQRYKQVDFKTAPKEIAEMQGISPATQGKVVATFEYKDPEGKTLYIKERIEPARDGRSKEFIFKHLKDGKWITGRGSDPVLYNLPELSKTKYAFVVEGEAKANLLMSWDLTTTCLDSGANSPFKDDYLKYFEGKEKIIILPDNDNPGKASANKIANALHGKIEKIKIVELPDLKESEDIIDWAKVEGNNKEKLFEIVKASPAWTPNQESQSLLSSLERWDYIQSLDIKVEWIVDRLIPKESITLVFGKGGIGKTWLLMDIARCIGEAISFLGLSTIKTPVIFVDFENPLAVLNTRTQKLGDCQNVYFWRANNEKVKPPRLDSNDWQIYKSLPKGAVLIFDTLRASHGKDENASNDMGLIMGRLKELRDMGFTVILLHHTAKNSDKVAKGSTAIVDLADHILGLTLVKKKQGGQDVVIEDDEDTEDEAVYKFGVREKTRFEPYHVYLTLNPDRGFELAPDPQEDILKEMHRILTESRELTKTAFIENCKGLGAGRHRLRKMVELGQGRYWNIERHKDQRNAQIVTPKIQFASLPPLYIGEQLNNCPDTPKNEPEKLDTENSHKTIDTVEFASLPEGVRQTEKLNLREGVL